MKKIIAVLVFFAFAVASASADFFWSAAGRGVFTPFAFSDNDSAVSSSTYNSAAKPRVGFGLAASSKSKNIGIQADFFWDGGIPGVGDNAKVWVKPFSIVRLTVGKFNEDTFRSIIGNTEFSSWILPSGGLGEDNIFTRFQASNGAHLSVTPLDGLFIEAALGSSDEGTRANRNLAKGEDYFDMSFLDVYKAVQAGVGYEIPNIGFARLQFIGNNRAQLRRADNGAFQGIRLVEGLTKSRDADVIEAAFQFTRIQNLNIDVGAKIPLAYDTDTYVIVYPALYPEPWVYSNDRSDTHIQLPYAVAVGAAYTFNDFAILARVDLSVGGAATQKNLQTFNIGPTLNVWINPSWSFGGIVTVGLDFGMEFHAIDTRDSIQKGLQDISNSDYLDIGFGPWVEKQVGGGSIKAGVMVMLPGSERYAFDSTNTVKPFKMTFSGEPVISVPISFTYSF